MIPSEFVGLSELPLTPSGKLDRKALHGRGEALGPGAAPFVPPRSDIEATLAEIWGALLGVERVSVHDDFFALGGHSLLATQVASRVLRDLGVDLPLRVYFGASTVAELAGEIEQGKGKPAPADEPIVAVDRRSRRVERPSS